MKDKNILATHKNINITQKYHFLISINPKKIKGCQKTTLE